MSNEIEQAKQLLAAKTKEQVERCRAKVEQILQEENCFIDVAMVLTQQGIFPQISIKPKPEN
jgi:hypothetical protein